MLHGSQHPTTKTSLVIVSLGTDVLKSITFMRKLTTSPKLRKRQARKELWMEKWSSIVSPIKFEKHYGVTLTLATAAFHAGLKSFKDYFLTLKNPESDFKPTRLLEIMDLFSDPLYTHLAAESQALLALAHFASPDLQLTSSRSNKSRARKQSR
jgi:hypothetical protein